MAIGSPILNRELLSFLRGKRAFVGLFVYLVILSCAAGLSWYGTLRLKGALDRDAISRNLFYTITIAQLLIFSAYALILTCTKINSEQDEKTLDLLITAPIRNTHIILAKYASSLAVILLMVAGSAPALSLCFLMGGVSWHEFLNAYYIVLLAVLSYGMMGIACSALFRKNYVSLFVGFFMALLFYGGATLLVLIFVELFSPILHMQEEEIIIGFFEVTSPIGLYVFSISPLGRIIPVPYVRLAFLGHTVFQGLVFLIAFLIARRRFRALSGRTTPAQKQREIILAYRGRRQARIAAAEGTRGPRRKRRYKPIPDGYNPVYAREDRQFLSRKWKHRILRFLMLGTAFAILAFAIHEGPRYGRSYRFKDDMVTLGMGTVFVVTLFVPLLAARAVTTERETQSLPMLVTTLMGPGQVIFGKLLVVMKHAFRAEVIFTFLLLLIFPRKPDYFPVLLVDWLKILLPLFAITLFFVSIGLFFSVLCRRTTTAVVLTYGTVLLLAFSPLIAWILFSVLFLRSPSLPNDLERLFAVLSPIASPIMYFIPDDGANFWHNNDRWGSIIGYSAVLLTLSAGLLLAAEMKFARLFRVILEREVPPPRVTEL